MTNTKIIKKSAFTVLGLGTTLSGDYQQLPAQKKAFWEQVTTDGRLATLKQQAQNTLEFAVNEAIDGAMHFYAGVQTAAEVSVGTDQREIHFPASEYLVVSGQAKSVPELFASLEGLAFGQALPSLTDKAYVGGPNATVITAKQADGVTGELWIPVVSK